MGLDRQGEGGALGKYTGKIKHSKIKFDNIFILGRSIVYIKSMRNIHLLGF